jgi:hypothetical protein
MTMTVERREWVAEIAATILLALAAIATAWSGYQAAEWHGEQGLDAGRANALRVQATQAQGVADRQVQIDVATFTQWVDARARGEGALASFYRRRFRDEFRPAFEAWIASRPLLNPAAAKTPFALPQYRPAKLDESEALNAEAAEASDEMKIDIDNANGYVLAAVLFATALALAGIGARMRLFPVRAIVLAVGWAVLIGTIAWLGTFPLSV